MLHLRKPRHIPIDVSADLIHPMLGLIAKLCLCVCGALWALDVSISATPGGGDTVHAHLERTAAAKASRYTPGGARRLPDGHTLVPLIYSADHGWLNLEGLAFLQHTSSQVAARDPPLGVHDWQPHVAQIVQQHLARLAHALHMSHWQMHQACGRLL